MKLWNVILMKVKYLGKTEFLVLTHNQIYDVISVERNWYRIIDDSGEDYLYPAYYFEKLNDEMFPSSTAATGE